MAGSNPWGENWFNENYSSAEMDGILAKSFWPRFAFIGFLPAGKRKWVRTRKDGVMEVIKILPGFTFRVTFGLSFPWIPHGDGRKVCWHKTPKSSEIDLLYNDNLKGPWEVPKSRALADERVKLASEQVCAACERWFERMSNHQNMLKEVEAWRSSPSFYTYVQNLTVYLFWQARSGKWKGMDAKAESQLQSYFGEEGFPKLKKLLEDEAARGFSN